MEQIHSKALEAIQPFIHLATSTASPSPRFLANLISNATAAPNTFVFAELLETPAVQSLRSPETPEEYRPFLTLLELFAWGTWEEYQSTPDLPLLNEAQGQKLRLLSLLTLARTHNPLTYSAVMTSLSLSSHTELESLVTNAIYSSLISARFSPATSPPTIKIISIAPLRDIRPNTLNSMVTILSEWQYRCQGVMSAIEDEIAKIKSDAQRRYIQEQARATRLERNLNGWDDHDDGSGEGGDSIGGAGSKRSLHFSRDRTGHGERKFGYKREFSAANDFGSSYGYPGTNSEMNFHDSLNSEYGGRLMRNTKRILGVNDRLS